jgi:uncharacterized protein
MQRTPRSYQFPNLLEAFFVVVVMFLLEYVTTSVITTLCRDSGLQVYHIASIGRVLACGLVFTVLLNCTGRSYGELIHASRASRRLTLGIYLMPILLIAPALLLADCVLMWFVDLAFALPTSDWTVYNSPLAGRLGVIALVCVIAPVVEEMLFRGVFLHSFLKQYPRNAAIVHSAGVFGMAHMNVHQFMLAFLIGLLLGKLYERTASLLPCILVHACLNTAVTILGFMHANDATPYSISNFARDWSPQAMLLAITSGCIGSWMLYRLMSARAVISDQAH